MFKALRMSPRDLLTTLTEVWRISSDSSPAKTASRAGGGEFLRGNRWEVKGKEGKQRIR